MKKIAVFGGFALTTLIAFPASGAIPVPPDSSCEHLFAWPDDLASHVRSGPLDGGWDYNFPGAAILNTEGFYDADLSTANWDIAYNPNSYLYDTIVEGEGTVFLNGDYKATQTFVTTDVLGQVWIETDYRSRRGCQEQRTLDPEGAALSHTGVWSAGRYDYEEQRYLTKSGELTGLLADVVGTRYADGSSEMTASYYKSGQEAGTSIIVSEQRNWNGERWIEMQLSSLDAARSVSTYIAPDGTLTKEGYYGYDPRWDYGLTVDYAGYGSGWMESGEYELYCHLDIGIVCTRTCWNPDDIEELEEVYEEQDLEFEFEYGDYIYDLEPEKLDNNCNSVLWENYSVLPY